MKKTTLISILVAATCFLFLSCEKDDINDSNGNDNVPYDDNYYLEVGDIGPAGGYIFYVNSSANTDGWKYLEAAPASTEWNNVFWGSSAIAVADTYEDIGMGPENTKKIIETLDDFNQGIYAARLCDELVTTHDGRTYDDWFLPSKDELNKIYHNLFDQSPSLGGFSEFNFYWSSTDYNLDEHCAWGQIFFDGSDNEHYPYPAGHQSPSWKESDDPIYSARAVRRF